MRRLTLIILAAGLALAGCSKKSSSTTPTPEPKDKEEVTDNQTDTPAGPDCAAAADNVDRLLRAEMGGRFDENQMAQMHAVVAERCGSDGWSAEAIACVAGASSGDDLDGCEHTLSKEQADAVDADMERIMGGGDGESDGYKE